MGRVRSTVELLLENVDKKIVYAQLKSLQGDPPNCYRFKADLKRKLAVLKLDIDGWTFVLGGDGDFGLYWSRTEGGAMQHRGLKRFLCCLIGL